MAKTSIVQLMFVGFAVAAPLSPGGSQVTGRAACVPTEPATQSRSGNYKLDYANIIPSVTTQSGSLGLDPSWAAKHRVVETVSTLPSALE